MNEIEVGQEKVRAMVTEMKARRTLVDARIASLVARIALNTEHRVAVPLDELLDVVALLTAMREGLDEAIAMARSFGVTP